MNRWQVTSILLMLLLVGQTWLTRPDLARASESKQAIGETPIEIYALLNQPGPLWLYNINLSRAELRAVNLRDANLYYANLERADLWLADLSNANLSFANLKNADLGSADLERAWLYSAELDDADLEGADLRKADLSGASLLRADLDGADLTEATYDEYTVWPGGFDPVKAGAVFESSGQQDEGDKS